MKLSVTTYSFLQLFRLGISQKVMLSIAKDLGFDGIEFTDLVPPEGMTQVEYASVLKEEAKRVGIEIVAYTIKANLVEADLRGEIERLKGQVDVARALGAPKMRHDIFFNFPEGKSNNFDDYLVSVTDAAREITQYAKQFGIKTMTENHGFICQHSSRVERIINTVNDDNFGWLVDMGNFLCVDQDPVEAVTTAAKYAFHVHSKDFLKLDTSESCIKTAGGNFIRGTSVGNGVVPVKECVKLLKEAGYDGFVTIEYEGLEPCIESLKKGMAYLNEVFKG